MCVCVHAYPVLDVAVVMTHLKAFLSWASLPISDIDTFKESQISCPVSFLASLFLFFH